jgi:ABC-2 type transport system ATP-binding protein
MITRTVLCPSCNTKVSCHGNPGDRVQVICPKCSEKGMVVFPTEKIVSKTTENSYAIEVKGLSKAYDGVPAVDEISFNVRKGEIFGFLGPNGAGKSTTVKMLTSQLPLTAGRVRVFGYEVTQAGIVRKLIGIVPQELSLNELLTAKQNMSFYGTLYGVPRKKIEEKAEELLSIMELRHRQNELVKNFSGGMKQRLNIILALLHNPKVLFLDEPTTGLDPQARRRIWDFIKEINGQGTTIFLTTHYMEEADYLCDRVAIIDEGKIVAMDTPFELKKKLEKEEVVEIRIDYDDNLIKDVESVRNVKQVGYADGALKVIVKDRKGLLLDIVKSLSRRNIKSLSTVEPSLEDVFVALTGKRLRD